MTAWRRARDLGGEQRRLGNGGGAEGREAAAVEFHEMTEGGLAHLRIVAAKLGNPLCQLMALSGVGGLSGRRWRVGENRGRGQSEHYRQRTQNI